MDKAKVALTYIVKDNSEKELFAKSLESFMPYFHGLYVAITGVSGEFDEIIKLVKKYKGKYITTNPQTHPKLYSKDGDNHYFSNFAEARNVSWSIIDEPYDYISWADADDVLAHGEEIEKLINVGRDNNMDMIFCTYWYACVFNEKGQVAEVVINHERERFIKPGSYKWVSRLHEVCIPTKPNPRMVQYGFMPQDNQNLVWIHTANYEKSVKALERNVRILETQIEEEEYKDPRTVFYLAKTYFDIGTPEKLKIADSLIDKYIAVSGWDQEKANAWEYKGLIALRHNNPELAEKCFLNAISVYPKQHTPYLRLADLLFKKNQDDIAVHYLDVVEKILGEYKSQSTIGNPLEIKVLIATLRYIQHYKRGQLDEAKKWAEIRHQYQKDGLLDEITAQQNKELVAKGFVNLATYYNKAGNFKALFLLLENAPLEFREENFLMNLSQLFPSKKWRDDEVCYFASSGHKHFEFWDGDSLKTGIGGSESAVIYLAEEWAKNGLNVTVYCDCINMKIIKNVLYIPYYLINWKDEFSTLILWRSPHLLDMKINAKQVFYDAHDIENMTNWPKHRVDKVSKVFFKSSWHRDNLPQIPNEKAVIISNGVTK